MPKTSCQPTLQSGRQLIPQSYGSFRPFRGSERASPFPSALLIITWKQLDGLPAISRKRLACSFKDEPFFDCSGCSPETALWLFHHYIRCCSLLALLSVLLSNSLGWRSRSPEHRGSSNGLGTQACCLCGGRAFSPQPRDAFGTFRFGGVQRRSSHSARFCDRAVNADFAKAEFSTGRSGAGDRRPAPGAYCWLPCGSS